MIVRQYEVGSFEIFCYLIGDEKVGEGLFIDPGMRRSCFSLKRSRTG